MPCIVGFVPFITAGVLRERERELETLREGLDRACAGEGMLLLIEGPAGVGKTALAREARAAAEQARMLPLEARGSELEQPFAFGVVRQLLESVVSRESDRDGLFAGGAGPAARLFEPDGRLPAADVGFEALHSLYWLVVNIADRAPVLILVDDCQWADPDSLRFLAYLAQRIEGLPVAMLLTGRPPDSAADEAGSLWAQVTSRPSAVALYPRPLSQPARGGSGAGAAGRGGSRGVLPRLSCRDRREPAFPAGAAESPGRRRGGAVGRRGQRSAGGRAGRGEPFRLAPAGRARPRGDRAGAGGRRARR